MNINLPALRDQLTAEEGCKTTAYQDTLGYWTIGIGACVDERVPGAGLCQAAINAQFAYDINQAEISIIAALPWVNNLNEVRQRALVDLVFNMGIEHLLEFKKMLAAMQVQDWTEAAAQLQDSQWWNQVQPSRRERIHSMILNGTDPA